ncbi:MAG: glycosyltransferase family 39 protein [Gammaproteobacteria bacterium]|nr:glycosyltransferase family 39 protein [Gammaproteobacteria bacterium]
MSPIRADAHQYVLYGYNLKNFGVFSQTDTLADPSLPPVPDAKRTPAYPLFLVPFLRKPITDQNIAAIVLTQAIISTFTVLIVFLLCRIFLSVPFALGAAALTALSPHLVTMNIYVLSETLFCFLLVMAIYITIVALKRANSALLFFGGATLAAAALTHPMVTYFIIPLIIYLFTIRNWKNKYRHIAMLALGFGLIFGPWVARNLVTLGSASDNSLMRIVLRTGAYTDLMYKGDRNSFPFPYHADPDFQKTTQGLPAVLSAIARSFREAPMTQLRWYLVGKPLLLYSWNMFEGQHIDERGDVFVYSVISTPYNYLPHFRATHAFMYVIHWVLVILMAIAVVIVWLPIRRTGFSQKTVLGLRIISLLLAYHLAIMIAGVPVSRYSIPLRPFMYIMAMVPLLIGIQWFRARTPRAKK